MIAITLALLAVVSHAYDRSKFDSAYSLPPKVQSLGGNHVAHHSLLPPFLTDHGLGSRSGMSHWSFGLGAVATNEYIRLTPNKQSREGSLWNDVPLQLESWTATLGFRVHAPASLGGDGFAFWIAERPFTTGGPIMGGPEEGFRGVGIIFDSFDNDGARDNPSVIVVARETSTRRGDLTPAADFSSEKAGGCTFDYRNTLKGDMVHAMVIYNAATKSLVVKLESTRQSVTCATVDDVTIPAGYYFGFTAHTGQLADNHDVHYFAVSSDELEPELPTSERAGANDGENVDARVRAAELRGRLTKPKEPDHPSYSHADEAAEKERWKAEN